MVVTEDLLIMVHQITQELLTVIYGWAVMKHLFILIVEAMEETGVVDVTEEVVEEAEEAKVEGMPMST
ncbi:hypothetical protein CW713_00050 [Methanophagales archaeon]|nr:MAG: hypothetical protein CW713_00050 [Methanophagales archaeon]